MNTTHAHPQNKAFHFTSHSMIRLDQRTKITRDEILEQLKLGRDLAPKTYCLEQGRLFWSPKDQRAFLAIYDNDVRTVITIMEAYHFTEDGQFRGTSYIEPGIGSHPSVWRQVKTKHVRDVMVRAGVPLSPAFALPQSTERSQRILEGTLRLQLMDEEGRHARQLRIGTFRVNASVDEIHLEGLFEALKRKQAILGELPWIISATIELRDRNAKIPECEIELDPAGLGRLHEINDIGAMIQRVANNAVSASETTPVESSPRPA